MRYSPFTLGLAALVALFAVSQVQAMDEATRESIIGYKISEINYVKKMLPRRSNESVVLTDLFMDDLTVVHRYEVSPSETVHESFYERYFEVMAKGNVSGICGAQRFRRNLAAGISYLNVYEFDNGDIYEQHIQLSDCL